MNVISLTLTLGKETKGTYRYEAEDASAAITTLYIRKTAFEGQEAPQTIRLAVEAA